MIRFSNAPSGRHFLQIPGPTNVPDRILRAIDHPTIDHRGPEFGALARKVLSKSRPSSRPHRTWSSTPLPMVGREQELALVLERWRQARAGEGQAMLLVGEPGIGKSRLVRAARPAARARC